MASTPEYRIKSLGPAHDRAGFSSDVPELDDYLRLRAGQDARRKVAAPFVLVDEGDSILGYYTLSAYSIRLDILPKEIARRLPRYPLIPATLLGRLAVSSDHRGLGIGRMLLMDGLRRSYQNTKEIASVGVVAEALAEIARAFYIHHEFMPMLNHPNRLFLPMGTIEKVFRAR